MIVSLEEMQACGKKPSVEDFTVVLSLHFQDLASHFGLAYIKSAKLCKNLSLRQTWVVAAFTILLRSNYNIAIPIFFFSRTTIVFIPYCLFRTLH